MNLKIGAGYVRVSSDDQTEYSPDSQIKLIRDYAKREGYIIPDEYIYRDDGISGKSAAKRPEFQLMIATAKQAPPPFDCIFVWKYSRFARNQEESLVYKNLLKKNGVAVKSISEPSSDDNPFSTLIERIIEWMDEYYSIRLSAEVKRGMKEKASRGEAMGRPPFGYRVENKMFVPDDNAPIVKYIFECYAAGRTFREIGADLSERGIKLQNGYDMNGQAVRYVLQNPAYIGKTRWDDEVHPKYRGSDYKPDVESLPDGKHDAIISRELWDTVQERLASRPPEVKYSRQGHPIYMLKGIARCGNCGGTLVSMKSKEKRSRLQCCRYSRGQCRVSHFIYQDVLEKNVIDALEEAVENKNFTFAPLSAPDTPRLSQDWGKLISAEESRLKRAREAYLDGTFTKEEYAEAKEYSEATIAALKEKQEKEMSKGETINLEKYQDRILSILQILKSPDENPENKNKALRSIVDSIVYNKRDNTIDIFFKY